LFTSSRTSALGYNGNDGARQKFTKQERDGETGLDYMHARYYASTQGRFTGVDPLSGNVADPQSWNHYSYVGNNPLNLTDPTGMFASPEVQTAYRNRELGAYGGEESWNKDYALFGENISISVPISHIDPLPQPQNRAALAPNGLASDRPLSDAQCDGRLAEIFGGPGAVVGSTRDPLTVGSNPAALSYAQKYGLPTDRIGERAPGHGPAPYNNPDPRSPDQGGIIHIYGNAQGTASNTPLYAPSGGTVGPIFTTASGNATRRVSYSTGLGISFVHVIPGGGPNRRGSVTLGTIGGPDSGGANYRHTHIVFFNGGTRVDPRRVFCGQ